MFTFFRRIRKGLLGSGATSKYLLYAIGEIALVVIGILIALQVNNWNEENKQKRQINSYAQTIITDLKEDIRFVKISRLQAKRSALIIDSLLNYTRNLRIENASNLELYLLSRATGYRPYTWQRASFEEVRSAGALRYLNNDTLINKIVAYEAFTQHMDLDYEQDLKMGDFALQQMGQVVNRNYSSRELRVTKTDYDQDTTFFNNYSSNPKYLKALKENLELLTSDISLIHRAINSYIDLRSMLETRYDNELPRLIDDAEEIIQLLQETLGLKEEIETEKE